ncbi:MAG: Uma2 family endonuclease [Bacteroidales bacterium]|nr:Uma2 family endonuclease [Bacteroidales bacterium]
MKSTELNIDKQYTYADYLNWMDDVRRELINGIVKLMTPAPSRKHQKISFNLTRVFGNYLVKRKCEGFSAPSDVRLPKNNKAKTDKDIFTVVQPDLYVVCDLSKLDDKGCLGAPDFIIEIVSPERAKRDVREKFDLYEEHGVKEYWIVNPHDENVNVFVLDDNGKYQFRGMFAGDDKIPVHIFKGDLKVDLTEVFIRDEKQE